MAVLLRAVVMIVALVGLPAAWVYYGPLPPGPQRIVDRALEVARTSLGWDEPDAPGRAPAATLPSPVAATLGPSLVAATPVRYDTQVTPAISTALTTRDQQALTAEMEPHLSLLRALGAAEYTLEHWGADSQLYRFRCAIALGAGDDVTRQFEAVAADPAAAVREVVGEATSWQNAREGSTQWR